MLNWCFFLALPLTAYHSLTVVSFEVCVPNSSAINLFSFLSSFHKQTLRSSLLPLCHRVKQRAILLSFRSVVVNSVTILTTERCLRWLATSQNDEKEGDSDALLPRFVCIDPSICSTQIAQVFFTEGCLLQSARLEVTFNQDCISTWNCEANVDTPFALIWAQYCLLYVDSVTDSISSWQMSDFLDQ